MGGVFFFWERHMQLGATNKRDLGLLFCSILSLLLNQQACDRSNPMHFFRLGTINDDKGLEIKRDVKYMKLLLRQN